MFWFFAVGSQRPVAIPAQSNDGRSVTESVTDGVPLTAAQRRFTLPLGRWRDDADERRWSVEGVLVRAPERVTLEVRTAPHTTTTLAELRSPSEPADWLSVTDLGEWLENQVMLSDLPLVDGMTLELHVATRSEVTPTPSAEGDVLLQLVAEARRSVVTDEVECVLPQSTTTAAHPESADAPRTIHLAGLEADLQQASEKRAHSGRDLLWWVMLVLLALVALYVGWRLVAWLLWGRLDQSTDSAAAAHLEL
jgi:hypothetical protein